MALVICHDVDSVTGEGLQGNQPSNLLNSTIVIVYGISSYLDIKYSKFA